MQKVFSIRNLLFSFTLLFIPFTQILAQGFCEEIGTTASQYCNAMVPTSDGGSVLVGSTSSPYFTDQLGDLYLVKLDVNGNILWTRVVTLTHPSDGRHLGSYGFDIIQDRDGDLVVAGILKDTYPSNYEIAGLVAKFDNATGATAFVRTYRSGYYYIGLNAIIEKELPDTGYYVSGYVGPGGSGQKDMYVADLNPDGTLLWNSGIGGNDHEFAYTMIQDQAGNIILAGSTHSFGAGGNDVYIVGVDQSGSTLLGARAYGTEDDEVVNDIVEAGTGYLLVGTTNHFSTLLPNDKDDLVMRVNSGLGLIGAVAINGPNQDSEAKQVIKPSFGGFLISGSSRSTFTSNYDLHLLRLSNSGAVVGGKLLNSSQSVDGGFLGQLTNGEIEFAGFDWNHNVAGGASFYASKMNAAGESCCELPWSPTAETMDFLVGDYGTLTELPGEFQDEQFVESSLGILDVHCPVSPKVMPTEDQAFAGFKVYPNPSNGTFSIELNQAAKVEITTLTGNLIRVEDLTAGAHKLDFSELPSGVYLLKAGNQSQKLVIQH